MILGGFQKLTLIDYPGKLASVVFTSGCSLRCPYCHNPELVLVSHNSQLETQREKEFLDFLKTRIGKLEGICITGGEPTIQPDIINFIRKIKKLGYAVKMDTNGTRPDVLKKIIDGKLIDYVAMDIKNSLKNYDRASGVKTDKERIKLSVNLIRNSSLPYEFRTTAVPGIHTQNDFLEIAKWLNGSKKYVLQKYRETKILEPSLKKKTKGKKINLEKIAQKIKPYFLSVEIR